MKEKNRLIQSLILGVLFLLFLSGVSAVCVEVFATGLDSPAGIVLDSGGNLYVVNNAGHNVQKFDSSGNFLGCLGGGVAGWQNPCTFTPEGSTNGYFHNPIGVAVDSGGNIYVDDYGPNTDRVQKFDSSGNFLLAWGGAGSGDGQFDEPAEIAISPDDFVYVADRRNNRVQKFDSQGNFITKWGGFDYPYAIAVDSDGNVYVADEYGWGRVQKFDGSGYLIARIYFEASQHYELLTGLGIDSENNVYVVVMYQYAEFPITKLTSDLEILYGWGEYGPDIGQLSVPYDAAVDSAGNIYVSELQSNRVKKFNALDIDGDGWYCYVDNCNSDFKENCTLGVDCYNPGQVDTDNSGIGDVCNDALDPDTDEWDLPDNCPNAWNPGQADEDGDGLGDACDDSDSDGIVDADDLCPSDPLNDADNDGICTGQYFKSPKTGDNDNCPNAWNPGQADEDNDGLGDACDDSDSDGIVDADDLCPSDPLNDADNDGICSGQYFKSPKTGDNDNCPTAYNPSQELSACQPTVTINSITSSPPDLVVDAVISDPNSDPLNGVVMIISVGVSVTLTPNSLGSVDDIDFCYYGNGMHLVNPTMCELGSSDNTYFVWDAANDRPATCSEWQANPAGDYQMFPYIFLPQVQSILGYSPSPETPWNLCIVNAVNQSEYADLFIEGWVTEGSLVYSGGVQTLVSVNYSNSVLPSPISLAPLAGHEGETMTLTITTTDTFTPEVSDSMPFTYQGEAQLVFVVADSDGDGVPDDEDECPTVFGYAQFNGCPAAIDLQVDKHTVGAGTKPGSIKEGIANMPVRLYDKSAGSCVMTNYGVSWHHYPSIWDGCEPVTTGTTDATGHVVLGAPVGDYIIIGQYTDTTTIYPGVSASDLLDGMLMKKYLQVIINSKNEKVPAKYKKVKGSELLIIEPEYVVWDSLEELYPFVFDAVGDWSTETSVAPPAGYTPDYDSLTANPVDEVEAVQFTIVETGSKPGKVKVKHKIKHKGRTHVFDSDVDFKITPAYYKAKQEKAKGKPFGQAVAESSYLALAAIIAVIVLAAYFIGLKQCKPEKKSKLGFEARKTRAKRRK